jgi:uncharacterized membrane protein
VAKGPVKPIESRLSFRGHPIHPTLVHFPVALLLSAVASDAAYFFTQDPFWFRASIWLVGVGALGGWFAGLVGLAELLLTRPIRHLITGWNHGILAVVMLSLATFNWMIRIEGSPELVYLWGFYMSVLTAGMILVTSVYGGQLVYEHAVGVNVE